MLRNFQLFAALLLISSPALFAQDPGGIDDSNVTIISNFEARLIDANRVEVAPINPPSDTSRQPQQYRVIERPLSIEYPAPIIRPRAYPRQKAETGKNGYASIGAGFPGALYGDLSYDLSGVENANLGLFVQHFSFNNSGKVENQQSSDTRFGAEGTYLFDQGFGINAAADFETQSRYYYGYNFPEGATDSTEIPSFTNDQARQRFNIFSLRGDIFNGTQTAANIDYQAGVALYLMDGDPAVRENGLDLNIRATKWIADDTPLDIHLRTDFTSYRDTSNQSLNNFYLSPSYTTPIAGKYRLKLGLQLASSDDNFFIFPDVSINAPLVEGLLSAFIGAEGSLQKNTLRSLSDYNPWVKPRLRIRNAAYTRVYGGVDGTFSGIAYRAEASFKSVDNLALFLLDRTDELPRFDVVYDDANIITLQASATAEVLENLSVNGTVAQRFYSLKTAEKAWHLPSFSLNAGATYTLLEDKLSLGAQLYLENGLPFRDSEEMAQNLNPLADLNLSGEYALSEYFSAWLRINNVLDNERERFAQYPTIGTNLLIGISAKF